jgi:hypothetical protein
MISKKKLDAKGFFWKYSKQNWSLLKIPNNQPTSILTMLFGF